MSSKKNQLVRYCHIHKWIEQQDSAFADAFSSLCLVSKLSPGRNEGVTFLYPKDKAYRTEIVDRAYSDEAATAVKMIKSLIIPLYLKDPNDFRKASVGTRLGVKLDLATPSTGNDKIKLKDGAVLAPEPSFKPLDRDNVAVWTIESGKVPLEGSAWHPPSASQGKKGARGGDVPGAKHFDVLTYRSALADTMEMQFDQCMQRDMCKSYNPYMGSVVSLMNFLKMTHNDLYECLLPLLDRDPIICFYLLLEPYKKTGDMLIPDSALFGDNGWNCMQFLTSPVKEYKALFEGTDVSSYLSVVNDVRTELKSKDDDLSLPDDVKQLYAEVESGSIRGTSGMFPQSTLNKLKNGKKLWQDEFRFAIYEKLSNAIYDVPKYNRADFVDIINTVRFTRPGDDYKKELVCFNVGQKGVSSPEYSVAVRAFISNTHFLYIATPEDVASRPPEGDVDNAEYKKIEHLNKYLDFDKTIERERALQAQYMEAQERTGGFKIEFSNP